MTLLKGIVVCLVLANVGYFLWERGIATPDTQPTRPSSLKLASEAPAAPRGASSAIPAPATASAANPTVAPGVASAPAPALAPAPGAATASAGGAAPLAGAVPLAGTGDAAAAAAAAAGAGAGATEAAPDGDAGLLKNVKRCISVGPFRDVPAAAHAAGTLRSGGYDPRQRVADGEVWTGVWVYLPLPASRPAADKTLEKLKAGGIDDALEMPGPTEGSVISLGLYSEPKRAQSRVAQAQALGFNPAIADRKRNGNVYWIDVDLKPTDSLLDPADLQGDAGAAARLEVKACPAVPGAAS